MEVHFLLNKTWMPGHNSVLEQSMSVSRRSCRVADGLPLYLWSQV